MTTANEPARRNAIAAAMGQTYRRGLTTASGGNISMRGDADGRLLITPAGVDKGAVTGEDIVAVGTDGVPQGRHDASSELAVHVEIFRTRPDVQAIVHAHPTTLVAYSLCHEIPVLEVLPEVFARCGSIGYAAYETTGSDGLGRAAAAGLEPGMHCLLLENHGVVVTGASLFEAMQRLEWLERAARIVSIATELGADFTEANTPWRVDEAPRSAVSADEAAAIDLLALARRAYERQLLVLGHGRVSVRHGELRYAISPLHADWEALEPGLLQERAIKPIDSVHATVYERHAKAGAIVEGIPTHALGLALARNAIETKTIPESFMLLGEVPVISAQSCMTRPEGVADALSPQQPVAVINGVGAIAMGTTTFDAIDRLEVLEATATSLVRAERHGTPQLLDDAAIAALPAAGG